MLETVGPKMPFPAGCQTGSVLSSYCHLPSFSASTRSISKSTMRVPVVAQRVKNLTLSMRMWVQPLALLSDLRIWCCHKLQQRSQSSLDLAWLWCRTAAAALIGPLPWEPPPAAETAPNKKEKKPTMIIRSFSHFEFL